MVAVHSEQVAVPYSLHGAEYMSSGRIETCLCYGYEAARWLEPGLPLRAT